MDASNSQPSRDQTARLLERHHPAGFGWALHCCRYRRDDAEEVLQAAYLKVLDGQARFGGRSEFRTWLFGVIRRTAAEQRRRRILGGDLFRRYRHEAAAADPVIDRGPEPRAVDVEARATLRKLLRQLSPRQRDLLHLVFYQELTIDQASRVLGVSLGTARVHYERGKQRMRALLEGQENENVRQAFRRTDSTTV